MTNKKNKGLTMVEIIVSVAIFSLLMIPIVSGIISAMKTTTKNKEIQNRNDLAENLLEYVKEDSVENILKLDYFNSIGSYDVKPTAMKKGEDMSLVYIDPLKVDIGTAMYDKYQIEGSMNLGTRHEKYSYKVEISGKPYAEKMQESAGQAIATGDNTLFYQDPNSQSLGIVEDLDYTKVALINGTIANYDAAVTDAFITSKLQMLRQYSPDQFDQYVNQAYEFNPFSRDKVKRQIIISVSGSKEKEYTVTCTLRYEDDSVYVLANGKSMNTALKDNDQDVIEYIPYSKKFEKLPNIYLMYNVCLYNGDYVDNDYIVIDTTNLEDEEQKTVFTNGANQTIDTTVPVNLFVIETASHYSKGVADTLVDIEKKTTSTDDEVASLADAYASKVLYDNRNTMTGESRDKTKIYFLAADKQKLNKLSNVNVYHNFDSRVAQLLDYDDNYDYVDYSDSERKNTKNQKIYVTNAMGNMKTLAVNPDGKTFSEKLCGPAITKAGNGKRDATQSISIKALNKAKSESRGLYSVKIWIEKGNPEDVDTSKDPLLTATKGGNVSDELDAVVNQIQQNASQTQEGGDALDESE